MLEKMTDEYRQVLACNGYTLQTVGDRLYLIKNGKTLPFYENLIDLTNDIKAEVFPPGTEFAMAYYAYPDEMQTIGRQWFYSSLDTEVTQIGDVAIITVIIIAAIFLISAWIFSGIFSGIMEATKAPPCGVDGRVIEVSECVKMVIMPNCDSRMYNACQEEWAEEEWHEAPPGVLEIMPWIIGGIVAVGGILLLMQFFKARERREYHERYPTAPPPPPPTPTIAERAATAAEAAARKVYAAGKKGYEYIKK